MNMRTITVNYTEILCNKNIDMRRLDQKNVGLIYLYFSLRKVIDIAFSCKLIIQFWKSHFGQEPLVYMYKKSSVLNLYNKSFLQS